MTLVRVKPTDQPTRPPRGHWRNKWRRKTKIDHAFFISRGALPLDDHFYFGTGKWISAEIAEQKAMERLDALDEYLGPVFIPDVAG